MIIKAYILAGDPAWTEQSIASYYDIIDELVVSFDQRHVGWTGRPMPVEECLTRLRSVDPQNKIRFLSGDFSSQGLHPREAETVQRQFVLDSIGNSADWVLQIDPDEVVSDSRVLRESLEEAEANSCNGLDFPARFLFARASETLFVERSWRFWRLAANYPGPIAIKPGTKFSLCRQCPNKLYRVDFAKQSTDPLRPRDAVVHKVIDPQQGIWHFAWIRDKESMYQKSQWSPHSKDFDWAAVLKRWEWAGKHPYLAMLSSPARRLRESTHVRVVRLPERIVELPEIARRTSKAEPAVSLK